MINRHECKYLINEVVAARIRADLAPFVRPDPHAVNRPGYRYPISSLYLDSEDLALYRTTIEGNRARFKLRVRSYSDDDTAPVVLEIKRRSTGIVRKSRCPIPRACLPAVLAGETDGLAELEPARAAVLREFIALMLAQRAGPRVIVRYDREAYVGRDGGGVRATFDRQLRALPTGQAAPAPIAAAGFVPVRAGMTLLELKFDDRCPSWMVHLVQRHELQRTSFSKYCHAVRATARWLPHLAI